MRTMHWKGSATIPCQFSGSKWLPGRRCAFASTLPSGITSAGITCFKSIFRSSYKKNMSCYAALSNISDQMEVEVAKFNRFLAVEEATTLPSSWYTSTDFAGMEMARVFARGWQAVGYTSQVEKPNDYFTGSLGRERYIICRDENGKLHAFHNVCRHHAAPVVSSFGSTTCFTCPYHGWIYGLDGRLQKASRLKGIKNFYAQEHGLLPINVTTWGHFVLINLDNKSFADINSIESNWLGSASTELVASKMTDESLSHVARREYTLNCNWKVFCDNYLDGGYHVPHAHQTLAAGLDLNTYTTTLYEKVSIQRCKSRAAQPLDRLGDASTYAFLYPNFMINRYGPWMDTNLVLPVTPTQCKVIFDYYVLAECLEDKMLIEKSLEESDKVQQEDIFLCEEVQKGLESTAYNVGRYAPNVEHAMHHFHCLLHQDLCSEG